MKWTDYREAVREDAKEYMRDNWHYFDSFEDFTDSVFTADSVTGNGSGSYTFNTAKAAENVAGIIFDDDAIEAFREYGYEGIPTDKGPEAVDVIARCYWVSLLSSELEDYWEELKQRDEEEPVDISDFVDYDELRSYCSDAQDLAYRAADELDSCKYEIDTAMDKINKALDELDDGSKNRETLEGLYSALEDLRDQVDEAWGYVDNGRDYAYDAESAVDDIEAEDPTD